MLQYIEQDITTIDRGIIAHGVNDSKGGVMGAGVALHLRKKYPQIFDNYSIICRSEEQAKDLLLGTTDFVLINSKLIIANCFTQHLGKSIYRPGKYEGRALIAAPDAIKDSLSRVMTLAGLLKFPVYLPPIGCGLGGLNWEADVEPIVKELANLNPNIDTYVCTWP